MDAGVSPKLLHHIMKRCAVKGLAAGDEGLWRWLPCWWHNEKVVCDLAAAEEEEATAGKVVPWVWVGGNVEVR
jgi:hypothetical protein